METSGESQNECLFLIESLYVYICDFDKISADFRNNMHLY